MPMIRRSGFTLIGAFHFAPIETTQAKSFFCKMLDALQRLCYHHCKSAQPLCAINDLSAHTLSEVERMRI